MVENRSLVNPALSLSEIYRVGWDCPHARNGPNPSRVVCKEPPFRVSCSVRTMGIFGSRNLGGADRMLTSLNPLTRLCLERLKAEASVSEANSF